jgi:hypothetical protein
VSEESPARPEGRPTAFEPDQILDLLASRRLLNPERLEAARDLSRQLARDPELLASIERMIQTNAEVVNRFMPTREELRNVGFDDPELGMPSPKQAAAAAAAGAAALIVGPIPVPV